MTDPAFPSLHGRPPTGWVNDPNGLALVDGRYHVFFQHNPDAPVHDRIAWGHATSTDLVTWEQHPVALTPRSGAPDAFGCWSGCLVVDGGVPTAVYSGVVRAGGLADVLLARGSADLRTWTQGTRPVAPLPELDGLDELRDPFVFTAGGRRFALQGGGRAGGPPRVLAYGCDDLERWEPLGELISPDDAVAAAQAPADVWECPNLVPIGDRWVLVLSLLIGSSLVGARWLLGDLDLCPDGPRFRAEAGGALDAVGCFYAPQLLVTPDRVLLWGWAQETRPVEAAWSGVLTFPRELSVAGGRVVSTPVPELLALRREPVAADAITERAFEVAVPPGAGTVTLALDGTPVVTWASDAASRVLVDGSLVEVFAGDHPVTVRGYPRRGSRWVVRTENRVTLSAWRLGLP